MTIPGASEDIAGKDSVRCSRTHRKVQQKTLLLLWTWTGEHPVNQHPKDVYFETSPLLRIKLAMDAEQKKLSGKSKL